MTLALSVTAAIVPVKMMVFCAAVAELSRAKLLKALYWL